MAFPHHHFQQQFQTQQQQPKSLRALYTVNGQISPPENYYDPANVPELPQRSPYVPPFHVVGLAPGSVAAADCSDLGADLQWYHGSVEPKKKRCKEQEFMENNSQISSIDFLQPRSVSTGLGLSLDNTRAASTGDSVLMSLLGDDIEQELQQQDSEIDKFLKLQGERLRQNILEKVQATQLQTLSVVEDKVLAQLREKQAEMESINRKNAELEQRMQELSAEAGTWQQRAKHNENMITALRFQIQHVNRDSNNNNNNNNNNKREGCGDSEVDDTASCCVDLQWASRDMKEMMTCKACRVKEVCMLLLPCKHLCLCRECEARLRHCPLCHSSKFIGMEVYM